MKIEQRPEQLEETLQEPDGGADTDGSGDVHGGDRASLYLFDQQTNFGPKKLLLMLSNMNTRTKPWIS